MKKYKLFVCFVLFAQFPITSGWSLPGLGVAKAGTKVITGASKESKGLGAKLRALLSKIIPSLRVKKPIDIRVLLENQKQIVKEISLGSKSISSRPKLQQFYQSLQKRTEPWVSIFFKLGEPKDEVVLKYAIDNVFNANIDQLALHESKLKKLEAEFLTKADNLLQENRAMSTNKSELLLMKQKLEADLIELSTQKSSFQAFVQHALDELVELSYRGPNYGQALLKNENPGLLRYRGLGKELLGVSNNLMNKWVELIRQIDEIIATIEPIP